MQLPPGRLRLEMNFLRGTLPKEQLEKMTVKDLVELATERLRPHYNSPGRNDQERGKREIGMVPGRPSYF